MAVEGGARYLFASLYVFSDAAKHEIIEKFQTSSAGHGCIIEFSKHDHVSIRCGKDDPNPLPNFVQLVKEFITLEMEKELDMTEDVKVERVAETQTETLDDEDPLEVGDIESQDSKRNEEDIVENTLIKHENFSRVWRDVSLNEPVDGKPRFSEKLLNAIGGLTNCRAELEPGGKGIIIKGDDPQDVEKAISKLNVINNWMSSCSTRPLTYNFQYSEGMLDILLEMVPLKALEDRRLHTTLISPQDPIIKYLGNHMTIVMSEKNVILLCNQKGRPSNHSHIKECTLWKGFYFKNIGDKGTGVIQMDQTPNAPSTSPTHLPDHPTVRTVQQWVRQSASTAASNPFTPDVIVEEPPVLFQEPVTQPDVQPPPVRKRHIKTRKPLGREAVPVKAPDPDTIESTEDSLVSTATTSLRIDDSAIARSESTSHEKSSSGVSDDSHSQGNESMNPIGYQKEQVAARGRPQNSSIVKPPPIEKPYMPAEPKQTALIDDSDPNPHWQQQAILHPRVGRLVDVAPGSRVQEKIQINNESDTRVFRRTMKQQKPASFTGSSSSITALIGSFEKAVKDILYAAKKSQGPLVLRMEIGRILIKPQPGSAENKRKQFSTNQWSSVFPLKHSAEKPETTFTNMLTTVPIDAQFILNLTSSGRQMFKSEPTERKVFYQFDCKTSTGDQVTVKVDEDGLFKIRYNESPIGFLNWHFPKRFWDARLKITSFEPVDNEIEKAAQEIVDNLHVYPSADRKYFDLGTKVDSGHLEIQSVLLCRETSHPSTKFPRILLHLSEMQDLGVWQPAGPKGSYEAVLQPPKNVISNGGESWWEASLSSIAVTEAFKENEELDLGSLAAWDAEVVAKEFAKELFDVTKDVVTGIDFVGYFNRGPKGNSGTKASEKDKKNGNEAAFW